MIRLIAIDLDGTLLDLNHQISHKNVEAIRTAQKKNIDIIITTGRPYLDAVIPIEAAGLKVAFSCLNGAEIRDIDGKIKKSICINKDLLNKVINILEHHEIDYDLFIGDYLYTRNIEHQITMFINFYQSFEHENNIRKETEKRVVKGLIKEVESYKALIEEKSDSVYKILGLSTNEKKLEKVKAILKELDLSISSSGLGNIEITNSMAHKGSSLEYFAKKKGITLKEVMVIGDSFNDISMMEKAGIAVAMGNAPDVVKEACHITTKSNEEDGVAFAIENVIHNI